MQVLSLGGSLISPRGGTYNAEFVRDFISLMKEVTENHARYVIVCGGGSLARSMQDAYRAENPNPDSKWLDRIGIAATRVHANLIGALCSSYARTVINNIPIDEHWEDTDLSQAADIIVSGGWIIGVSTDYIAVLFANKLNAEVINISDMPYIYQEDPRANPTATPLYHLSWKTLSAIIGDQWQPGAHLPFDPQAARLAAQQHIPVKFVGPNIDNLRNTLLGQPFEGTTIKDE